MIVACDIGGVVRNIATGDPVVGALEGLAELSTSCSVIFISKCGQSFQQTSAIWLAENGLGSTPTHFYEKNEDKIKIAKDLGVNVMIDDRIQVLRTFPEAITKIWYCEEEKKIAGTRKHQPELFESLQLARTWEEVVEIVRASA